jgi:hypothetical protein
MTILPTDQLTYSEDRRTYWIENEEGVRMSPVINAITGEVEEGIEIPVDVDLVVPTSPDPSSTEQTAEEFVGTQE